MSYFPVSDLEQALLIKKHLFENSMFPLGNLFPSKIIISRQSEGYRSRQPSVFSFCILYSSALKHRRLESSYKNCLCFPQLSDEICFHSGCVELHTAAAQLGSPYIYARFTVLVKPQLQQQLNQGLQATGNLPPPRLHSFCLLTTNVTIIFPIRDRGGHDESNCLFFFSQVEVI